MSICSIVLIFLVVCCDSSFSQTCNDGDVQLNPFFYYGFLEVCSLNEWRRVCGINSNTPTVVCRQLGLLIPQAAPGVLTFPIQSITSTPLYSSVDCSGLELRIGDCLLIAATDPCVSSALACPLDNITPCTIAECPDNSQCVLGESGTITDVLCECNPGFSGPSCIDINECQSSGDPPCTNGICFNTEGSFFCDCDPGFDHPEGDPIGCTDINECEGEGRDSLCLNGRCMNTEGGFRCECNSGFKPSADERACEDINECKERTQPLCTNGKCINVEGSFFCDCDPGYIHPYDDPITCQDINECEEGGGNNLCLNGRCSNIDGDYICICNSGYQPTRDFKFCEEAESNSRCPPGTKKWFLCDGFILCIPQEISGSRSRYTSRSSKTKSTRKTISRKP